MRRVVMAKSATTRSDVLEQEYEVGVRYLIWAGVVLIAALLVFWCWRLVLNSYQNMPTSTPRVVYAPLLLVTGVLGVIAMGALAGMGAVRMSRAKQKPSVTVNCPYCDFAMEFPAEPTIDWDCEGCHRRVHYEDGKMVEIKQITCTFCKTVHKVAATATTYMC